jgi:hypothetical protein
MASQNYSNHRQFVPLFHAVLALLIVATLAGSVVNLVKSWGDHERLYSASLIVVVSVCLLLLFWFCRTFPLKAQDRAIRAEENLRHYVLAGKLLDPRLETLQIVALRFASDAEFPELAKRAANEQLKPDDIKKAVRVWRSDLYRV